MDVLNWSVPDSFLDSLIYFLVLSPPILRPPTPSCRKPIVDLLRVCSVAGEGVGEAALPFNTAVWRGTEHAFSPHLNLVLKLRSSIHGLFLYWWQDLFLRKKRTLTH